MEKTRNTIIVVCIFCVAMAALESAVVVYLRALYYADGFTVAMRLIDQQVLLIEIAREAATVIMLASIGYLAGNDFKNRWAYFLMAFAVWDIFYYVWLKVFIDWPSSLLEWDILFLIPFTWLGPVLAPVICSVVMLILAAVMIRSEKPLTRSNWMFILSGSVVILFTFMRDYGAILISNGFLGDFANLMRNQRFLEIAGNYLPTSFSWVLFLIGIGLIAVGIVKIAGWGMRTRQGAS